jgi:hypothetical protein
MARRFTVVPRYSGPTGFTGKVVDDSEMDRLLYHDRITSFEHSILIALLRRLQRGAFIGMRSPDMERSTVGDPARAADRKMAAVVGCCVLIAAMDKVMGKGRRMALVNLCLLDQPWPWSVASLQDAILALQRLFADRQRPVQRAQPVDKPVAFGVNADLDVGPRVA